MSLICLFSSCNKFAFMTNTINTSVSVIALLTTSNDKVFCSSIATVSIIDISADWLDDRVNLTFSLNSATVAFCCISLNVFFASKELVNLLNWFEPSSISNVGDWSSGECVSRISIFCIVFVSLGRTSYPNSVSIKEVFPDFDSPMKATRWTGIEKVESKQPRLRNSS